MRFLWIIISKITLSETLAKHILFTSDRYSKLNVQDYIIFLQYELNIHLFYQELQIKTNRSKTYTDIPYRNWTWQHSERSSFIIRKHIKIEKEKGDEKKKKYFVNLQTILILSMKIWDINIHILTKYVTFRKIVICMFQKNPQNYQNRQNATKTMEPTYWKVQAHCPPKHFLRILRV